MSLKAPVDKLWGGGVRWRGLFGRLGLGGWRGDSGLCDDLGNNGDRGGSSAYMGTKLCRLIRCLA